MKVKAKVTYWDRACDELINEGTVRDVPKARAEELLKAGVCEEVAKPKHKRRLPKMTTVKLRDRQIDIEGHAGYAQHGYDVVCSAISILTETLIDSITYLTSDEIEVVLDDINAGVHISFGALTDRARVLVDAFFMGICSIAEQYPYNCAIV